MTNGPYVVSENCLVFAKNIEEENERLRVENEKLREALKPFADFYYNSRPCTDNAVICEADDGDEFNILHGHFRKAYQVLETTK